MTDEARTMTTNNTSNETLAGRVSLGLGGDTPLDATTLDATTLDVTGFEPRRVVAAPALESARERTRRVAEAAGFRSREPRPRTAEAFPRRRRTGRNAQLNIKARPDTIAAFAALADRMEWGFGETLEHAVALLEREHAKTDGGTDAGTDG